MSLIKNESQNDLFFVLMVFDPHTATSISNS